MGVVMGYIRFSLAVLVLISHTGLASESLSRTAVSLFFVLSGFLMQLTLSANYAPLTSNSMGRYFSNRFLRIFPLYWISLLVIAITNFSYFQSQTSESFFGVLVLDHQSAGKVIGPAWTLPYEITYFLLAPLLTLLNLRWVS